MFYQDTVLTNSPKKQVLRHPKLRQSSNSLKVISLFSGCGGMDLGLEGGFRVLKRSINPTIHPDWLTGNTSGKWAILPRTKFKTIFANDLLPEAKAAWEPYLNKERSKTRDFRVGSIVEIVKQHLNGQGSFPKSDLVVGGFPCQDFSLAGKRNGFNSHKCHLGNQYTDNGIITDENRGKLYIWMRHVIDIVRPKVFIAENVKGLVSLKDVKETIENDFKQIGPGYIVTAKILYAPHYGIPQKRERIFFIGFRKDALTNKALCALSKDFISPEFDPFPVITHAPPEATSCNGSHLFPFTSAGDFILDLPEPEQSSDLSQRSFSKAKWYGRHCQGQAEVNLDGLAPTIRSEHHGNIEFRRLAKHHGGRYLKELHSGLKERRLTVRECARLQTFPDNFEFVRHPSMYGPEYKLSASAGYKLVGNAVPPLLSFHIAWKLQSIWGEIMR